MEIRHILYTRQLIDLSETTVNKVTSRRSRIDLLGSFNLVISLIYEFSLTIIDGLF